MIYFFSLPSAAIAAAKAGKHVIVEKPLALTIAQADELVAVARRRDVVGRNLGGAIFYNTPLWRNVSRPTNSHNLESTWKQDNWTASFKGGPSLATRTISWKSAARKVGSLYRFWHQTRR